MQTSWKGSDDFVNLQFKIYKNSADFFSVIFFNNKQL